MRPMRMLTAVTLLGAVLVGGRLFAAPWTAKDDPDLAARIAKAAALKVENLGVPVTTTTRGELMQVPNPDGKTYDLLQWYWQGYGGPTQVNILDTATGETKVAHIPKSRQIHICGRALAPNGKLYLATPDWRNGMELYIYDPATNDLVALGMVVPGLAGERRDMVVAPDGKIYATGSYGKEGTAGAYQIDPDTNKITIYGSLGPSHKPNGVWGYSVAADDRYVYVASGKVPWYLVVYDRQTGKQETPLTTGTQGYVGVRQHRYGCSGSATNVVGTDGKRMDFWLYQGKVVLKKDPNEKPPWMQPAKEVPWVVLPPRPELWTGRTDPDSEGHAELWYRNPDVKAAAPKNPPADAKPEDLGWKVVRWTVPTYPAGIYRVHELPDGRIFGAANPYMGNFVFDPATGKSEHLGKIHLSHYATAIADNKVYMSGYPSSPLYIYDIDRPWTANTAELLQPPMSETDKAANPRKAASLHISGAHKMYVAAVGADGKVYFGGRWARNGSGGGFAWYDPKTGKVDGFWQPLSNYQVGYLTTAADGKLIVISTMAIRDAVLNKPTPEQGKLFIFDTAQGKVVCEIEPVLKARGAGVVAAAGGGRVLGLAADPDSDNASILYGVDVTTGEVAFRKKVAFKLGAQIGGNQKEAWDFRLGPDGKVWTFFGGALVRIDPADAAITVVGKCPGGRLAFSGKDIYLSGSSQLRRVAGVVGE